ncbi:GNAT family N-acetyltransferase [Cytobacillus sp. FSL R5-0569]|uniref:GNAT family N-acetyltransferase n=1 Tax=Cytobacillus TaxID=2675230 RepID=UPI0027D874FB|nr:GNAT family N-acetyltransferase [Cytobacillus kochii]
MMPLMTERCVITPLSMKHLPTMVKLYRNAEVREYLGGIRTIEQVKEQMENMLMNLSSSYWIVSDKYTHHHLGFIALTPHHCKADIEVSYQFFPHCWGKGYASETVYEVLMYAFFTLKEQKVVAETQVANKRSCQLLEKLGFTIDCYIDRFGARQVIYKLEKKLKL